MPPTSANRDNVILDLSAHIMYDGIDLGLLDEKVKLKLPNKTEAKRFAHSQADYLVHTAPDNVEISGEMSEATSALLQVLISQLESADGGNRLEHSGEFNIVLPVGEIYLTLYHDKAFFKRIHLPQASISIDGEIDLGSGADIFSAPFKIVGLAGGDYLYAIMHTSASPTANTVTPSPADAATGVAVDAAVTVTFAAAVSETMAEAETAAPHLIRMIRTDTGVSVLTGVTWNAGRTVATLTHANFPASTGILVLVDRYLRSQEGSSLRGNGSTDGTDFLSNFTTA